MAAKRLAVPSGAVLTAILLYAIAAPACAQQSPGPAPQLPPARIIVNGNGSVSVPPDYAEIASGATNQAKTAKEASDANAKVIVALTAALKNEGIAANDIQTLRFSVSPVYGTPQQNSPPKLVGFSVSNELGIKVRQIGKVGEVLDSLIQAGATNSGSVQFLHSNMSQVLDQARQAALADARRKAALYAQSAGLKLGGVAWVTEVPAYAPPTPFAARAYAVGGSVPISAGTDMLNVQVTVGFEAAQ